jgi:Asp-tRNA(Asn)/Glu-tRNA(Gln) amidotransferase C subunit
MFKIYIDNYHESIEGLKDFVELIDPFLFEHSKKVAEQHEDKLMPLHIARLRFLEQDEEKKEEYTKQLNEIFEGEIEVDTLKSEDDDSTETGVKNKRKGFSFKFKGDTSQIDEAFQKLSKTANQKELLFKNSLISLLSSVEWFYSQILHFHYDKFPDSAGIKKKTLTLEELKLFNNFKDAENYLIDEKIESILRASFKEWLDVLRSELSLKMTYLTDFEDELIEIYQRRNILVHNGGTVNSIYLSKVKEKYKKGIQIGDKMSVSEEYLERAISLLHTTFTLIACELWKKLEPNEEERCKVIMELGYEYLKKGMWDISEISSLFLCTDKKMPIASRTAAQLNFWLSKKRSGKFEDVKKEVEDEDFSDKAKVFQAALHSLREETDAFFFLLPQIIKTEELEPKELMEFPIFSSMREKEEFKLFIENNEKMVDFFKVNIAE